jgi:glycosyltransferase involved in cell wall biosynthesis
MKCLHFTFYKQIDVYVCFSTYEGSPNTILEASACGKAWISTNVGNIPEMIEYDDNCGIMIEKEPIDIGEKLLEENLIRLYNNREKIIEMGNKARNVIEEHFNYINIVNNTFEKIFNNLLNNNNIVN